MPCTEQDFYGSAIRGTQGKPKHSSGHPLDPITNQTVSPTNSTLREVPDHQELFLSRTTLSNLIVEVNQRVSPAQAMSTMTQPQSHQPVPTPASSSTSSSSASSPETVDKAAALYHLHDLCDEGDTLETIVPAEKVLMAKLPAEVRAYKGVVSYTTPKRGAAAGGRIPVSVDGAAAGSESAAGGAAGVGMTSRLTCHYLLVRLEKHDTDVVVFFNVPHEEFDGAGDPRGLSREEELGAETVDALVGALEVRDWGLFG
ncbi:Ran-interacting protein Mog1 [Aspergillus sp. HF37]|nr:Ran-interacting protein Mog1 [Aspergillus sp. HF37]